MCSVIFYLFIENISGYFVAILNNVVLCCWKIVAFDNVLRCCGQCVVPDSVIYCIDIILMLCYWLLKMCCWKCCCGVILKYVTVVVLLTNCCWIITYDDMLLLILLLLYHWGCWGFDVGRGCSLLAFSLFCCKKKRIFFSISIFQIFLPYKVYQY